MLADQEITASDNGLPSKGIQKNVTPYALVHFVESHLDSFADQFKNIKAENRLTYKLVVFLNQKSRKEKSLFLFQNEMPQDEKQSTVDFGVHGSDDEAGITFNARYYKPDEAFFAFEAKILGVSTNKKLREKEYLIGHYKGDKYNSCGGVERFKKNIHGQGLKYAGIIGYIQEHDHQYWYNTINAWIANLTQNNNDSSITWAEKDKLKLEDAKFEKVSKYRSANARMKKDEIILFHLWVNLRL